METKVAVLDDCTYKRVVAYAERNGVSVAEAMSKILGTELERDEKKAHIKIESKQLLVEG